MDPSHLLPILLLIFGFGFVVFWHELGHFLAAKWAGVKVEQFAVGFGQALVSYRRGIGVRLGSSQKQYQAMVDAETGGHEADQSAEPPHMGIVAGPGEVSEAMAEATGTVSPTRHASVNLSGVGETEYRLNWIPLGGYVKMLGQDDLRPNSEVTDPKAYNNKPVYQRMVIVSAGVIMNVILAAILFTVLFSIGFNTSPPLVGSVQAGSPAQAAGLAPGDRIIAVDGSRPSNFEKVAMAVALSGGEPFKIQYRKPDGSVETREVTPRASAENQGFQSLGVMASPSLRGPAADADLSDLKKGEVPAALFDLKPGEAIVAVNGKPVHPVGPTGRQKPGTAEPDEYYKLADAVQASGGKAVSVTVEGPDGKRRDESVQPYFAPPFGGAELNFAGLMPRATIVGVEPDSPALGKLKVGDVVLSLRDENTQDMISPLTGKELAAALGRAGAGGYKVGLTVERGGKALPPIGGLTPNVRLGPGKWGLRIGLGYDDAAVVGGVLPDSAAAKANLPAGATLVSVGGKSVKTWSDVRQAMAGHKAGAALPVVASIDGREKTYDLAPTEAELNAAASYQYATALPLQQLIEPRQTRNPALAAWWGVVETRDLITQFYLTLRRMVTGSISPANVQGPLGIVHVGSIISGRGTDYLLWFLALISANLAVVNFLPIPIVDGGLFAFLIFEKVTGKPPGPTLQTVAQLCGLVLLAGVFLFVTYNDLQRMFF